MKRLLILFLLFAATTVFGENPSTPDIGIMVGLTPHTVHDVGKESAYIVLPNSRNVASKVYIREIFFCVDYYFLVGTYEYGKIRYGVMDILGNLLVPMKYTKLKKALLSKEWEQTDSFRREHESAYSKRYGQIMELMAERVEQRQFASMLSNLQKSRNSKYTETVSFRRGKGALKRIRIGNNYGLIDSLGNLLLDVKYTEIRLLGTDEQQPYNRLFPVKESRTGNNISFVDYIGEYVWENKRIKLEDRLSWNTGEGRDCYVFTEPDSKEPDKYYYVSQDRRRIDLDKFCSHFVSLNMEYWSRKDEFESLSEYQLRQSAIYTGMAMEYYARCAVALYQRLYPDVNPFELCEYDKDNGSFLIKSEVGNIASSVPFEKSMQFRKDWIQNKVYCRNIVFTASKEELSLSGITFSGPGYIYTGNLSTDYYAYNVETSGDKIVVKIRENAETTVTGTTMTTAQSEVDLHIPRTYQINDKTFVVIISNENYIRLSRVPFALNDGETFRKYCNRTLGIPEGNIRIYKDATFVEMRRAITDIREIASIYRDPIRLLFYYSGHGAPQAQTGEPYLLPVDAFGVDPETCYSKNDLYRDLSQMNISTSVVFLDACFCGEGRDAQGLTNDSGVRTVKMVPMEDVLPAKIVAFNASSKDETAMPYKEKGHGLFTYFLLKKLQLSRGDVSLGELADYLQSQVSQNSKNINNRLQIPNVSDGGISNWRTMKLLGE